MPTAAQEALDQRNTLVQSMRDVIDAADADSRRLTSEEVSQIEGIEADIRQLDADTEARARVQAAAEDTSSVFERGLGERDEPAGNLDERGRLARPEAIVRGGEGADIANFQEWRAATLGSDRPHASDEYRQAFYRAFSGYRLHKPTSEEIRALSIGTATAGGNLVPVDYQRELIPKLRTFGVMRQIARVITRSTGAPLDWPRVTGHGVAGWTGEGVTFTESDEAFDQIVFGANKATTSIRASEELLTDSVFDLPAYIADEFGQRVGVLQNTAYVNGSGTGQPRGFLQDAVVGVTETVGHTLTIDPDSIIDLYHSVPVPYRAQGVYVSNDLAIAALRKVKASGTGQYMWQPSIQVGQPDVLFGKPIYADPDMPAPAANAKSMAFGDFKRGYIIMDVDGVYMQQLNELFALSGQVGWRCWHRTDGHLVQPDAIRVLKHSAT